MTASGKRPPGGDDRASGIGEARPVAGTDAVSGADEVEALDEVKAAAAAEVGAVRGPDSIGGTGAVGAADAVAEVAGALRAGRITVAEAVDRLIEDAIGKQVGRAIEPGSELEARLRRVLRDYAGADPLITAKIRRLEGRRPTR